MAKAVTWSESTHEIAGLEVAVSRAGSGRPVMVLHHDIGTPGRCAFYDALAQKHDVIVPHHPGFAKSPRGEWLRHPRDYAVMYQALRAALDLEPTALVGLGFGGWIAAEMATFAPREFGHLKGTSSTRRSSATSTMRGRASMRTRPSPPSMGPSPAPTSSSIGTSAARCASASPGSPTCTARRSPICSQA
jgi:pimeloyl-ACP methyl ester carboxylesterase